GVIVDSLADLIKCTQSYQPGTKVVVVMSKERAKLGPGWQPATVQKRRRLRLLKQDPNNPEHNIETHQRERSALRATAEETVTVHTCPKCGAIVRDEEG